jgi:hypothetical protein
MSTVDVRISPLRAYAWTLPSTLLFAAAYLLHGILHELSHALAIYLIQIPGTLYHSHVEVYASGPYLAVVAATGPLYSAVFGVFCWIAYRRSANDSSDLLIFYLSVFGIARFLGSLMSIPLFGDFNRAAYAVALPKTLSIVGSLAGLAMLAGFMFFVGREMRKWAPPDAGPLNGMLGIVVIPTAGGALLSHLAYGSVLPEWTAVRIIEHFFWIVAAVGAWSRAGSREGSHMRLRLQWRDCLLGLLAVVLLRILSQGIRISVG